MTTNATTITAICSADLELPAGQLPDSIKLIPIGKVDCNDGRKFEIKNAAAVVAASKQRAAGLDLPIDYEHQVEYASKNGQPAPAAGWIKDMEARPDGIYGTVKWTDRAAEMIRSREYRYISPVFTYAKDGQINMILRAALVNAPALDMPALAKSIALLAQQEPDMNLEKLITALRAKLGMKDEATEEEMMAAIDKMAAADNPEGDPAPEPEPEAMSAICAALGIAKDTPVDQVVTALAALKNKGTDGNTVNVEDFKKVTNDLAVLRAERDNDAAEAAVDVAIAAGKITPASKESMLVFCKADRKGFDNFVETAPTIVQEGEQYTQTDPGGTGDDALTATEVAVCKQLGLTTDEFIASRKQQSQA